MDTDKNETAVGTVSKYSSTIDFFHYTHSLKRNLFLPSTPGSMVTKGNNLLLQEYKEPGTYPNPFLPPQETTYKNKTYPTKRQIS